MLPVIKLQSEAVSRVVIIDAHDGLCRGCGLLSFIRLETSKKSVVFRLWLSLSTLFKDLHFGGKGFAASLLVNPTTKEGQGHRSVQRGGFPPFPRPSPSLAFSGPGSWASRGRGGRHWAPGRRARRASGGGPTPGLGRRGPVVNPRT